jgi:ribosomal protein L12E/L44/L45/RPP1/RPP2
MIEIRNRYTGAVIYRSKSAETLRGAVIEAVAAGADLTRANLTDADLTGANLEDVYLAGANLTGAYGVPDGASAEPQEPYKRPETDEEFAALYARRAAEYRERNPHVPVVPNLDAQILALVDAGTGKLEMSSWHGGEYADENICSTTHCRAGWAIAIAGKAGRELERNTDAFRAGRAIYLASTGRVPHFFASNERALEDLRECAARQTMAVTP